MHIEFGREKDDGQPKWEHPVTKRVRRSDILFLRILIVLTLAAAIYLGPVHYVLMQNQQAASGVLNDAYVEALRNKHIYRPNHILHLQIDGRWYQLMQAHSEQDIRDIKWALSSVEGKETHFRYVSTIDREPHLVQLSCEGKDYMSSEVFEQSWTRDAVQNSVHGAVIILICLVIYLFRCGFIRVILNRKGVSR